jgi:hypothetical protein
MSGDRNFPWGEPNPVGGFKVGDYVGLIYSDHEEYIFDNPEGVVTAVEQDDDEQTIITVAVSAQITADRVYLIARPE